MGEGILLLGILFEHFSVGINVGFGNILDPQLCKFSIGLIVGLTGADIGLILLFWVDFLNPKDDANPLVAGSWLFGYWLAWKKNKHLLHNDSISYIENSIKF